MNTVEMNRVLSYVLGALCLLTAACILVARGYISGENALRFRKNLGNWIQLVSGTVDDGKDNAMAAAVAAAIQRNLTVQKDDNGTKIMLLWTTWFGDPAWGHGTLGSDPFKKCDYTNCITTADTSYMDRADMLLFHCRDGVKQWPTVRLPRQYYAVECQESQTYSDMSQYSFRANISVTHRLDSDVIMSYFIVVPRTEILPGPYVPKVPLSKRTKGVVWPVSHCRAPSNRDHYAKELSRYIDVDIFGACGKNVCPRGKQEQCMDEFEQQYKFFLSFENTFCEHYVTEKFSNGLRRDFIPVVFGAANYSLVAPKHSYIDTRDFESPRKLAEYLLQIAKNETAFNAYFQWKREFSIKSTDMLCETCKFLHNTKGLQRDASKFDIGKWWKPPGVCDDRTFDARTNRMRDRKTHG